MFQDRYWISTYGWHFPIWAFSTPKVSSLYISTRLCCTGIRINIRFSDWILFCHVGIKNCEIEMVVFRFFLERCGFVNCNCKYQFLKKPIYSVRKIAYLKEDDATPLVINYLFCLFIVWSGCKHLSILSVFCCWKERHSIDAFDNNTSRIRCRTNCTRLVWLSLGDHIVFYVDQTAKISQL